MSCIQGLVRCAAFPWPVGRGSTRKVGVVALCRLTAWALGTALVTIAAVFWCGHVFLVGESPIA